MKKNLILSIAYLVLKGQIFFDDKILLNLFVVTLCSTRLSGLELDRKICVYCIPPMRLMKKREI